MSEYLSTSGYERIDESEVSYTIWSANYYAAIEGKSLDKYDVQIDPDVIYTVQIGEKEETWSEQEVWEWMIKFDCQMIYAATKFGDQEMVLYSKEPRSTEETELTICGPEANCGCREYHFPKFESLSKTESTDYAIEREQE